jgi:hypothetical protein
LRGISSPVSDPRGSSVHTKGRLCQCRFRSETNPSTGSVSPSFSPSIAGAPASAHPGHPPSDYRRSIPTGTRDWPLVELTRVQFCEAEYRGYRLACQCVLFLEIAELESCQHWLKSLAFPGARKYHFPVFRCLNLAPRSVLFYGFCSMLPAVLGPEVAGYPVTSLFFLQQRLLHAAEVPGLRTARVEGAATGRIGRTR